MSLITDIQQFLILSQQKIRNKVTKASISPIELYNTFEAVTELIQTASDNSGFKFEADGKSFIMIDSVTSTRYIITIENGEFVKTAII